MSVWVEDMPFLRALRRMREAGGRLRAVAEKARDPQCRIWPLSPADCPEFLNEYEAEFYREAVVKQRRFT